MSETHPSFLALDRHALGDSPDAASIQKHLDSCDRCRAHLATVTTMPPAPAWLEGASLAPARRSGWRGGIWALALSLAAASAGVVLFARGHESVVSPVITEKGGPEIAVHVKRGSAVTRWDGHSALRVGDRLRLQIRAGGFRFVSVAVPAEAGQAPRVMYAGPLAPSGATLLPLSFRVDESEALETLDVILGVRPPAPEDHARVEVPPGGWRRRIEFAKERTQ